MSLLELPVRIWLTTLTAVLTGMANPMSEPRCAGPCVAAAVIMPTI